MEREKAGTRKWINAETKGLPARDINRGRSAGPLASAKDFMRGGPRGLKYSKNFLLIFTSLI